MKLLLQVCSLAGSCLIAAVVAAQPILSDIDPVVQAYYEQKCSAQLNAMLSAFNSQGMNGPAVGAFYMGMNRLDAAGVREKARQYLDDPGVVELRRWGNDLDRLTNIWENCLVNAREEQLGLPITRFTIPPPIPPSENFSMVNGEEVMRDGTKCIRVLTSQSKSGTQAGYFDQWATIRNKCNREIEVRVCKPDGTCMQIMAPPDTEKTHLLGTTQGLAPDWDVTGTRTPQAGDDPPQQDPDPPRNPVQPPNTGGNDVTGPDNTPIDFGDDSSQWAHDGECDDPRFSGPGSAAELVEADYFHDASDCRALLAAGRIEWTGYTERGVPEYDAGPVQDEGSSFGLDDALGIFREVVNIYADYENATNPSDADSTGDGDYGGEDDSEYDSDEDDCPYNSDGDPTTVCTVQ